MKISRTSKEENPIKFEEIPQRSARKAHIPEVENYLAFDEFQIFAQPSPSESLTTSGKRKRVIKPTEYGSNGEILVQTVTRPKTVNKRVFKKHDAFVSMLPSLFEKEDGCGDGGVGFKSHNCQPPLLEEFNVMQPLSVKFTTHKSRFEILNHGPFIIQSHPYKYNIWFQVPTVLLEEFTPAIHLIDAKEGTHVMMSSKSADEKSHDIELLYQIVNETSGLTKFIWSTQLHRFSYGFNKIMIYSYVITLVRKNELMNSEENATSVQTIPIYISPPFGVVARKSRCDTSDSSLYSKITNEIESVWENGIGIELIQSETLDDDGDDSHNQFVPIKKRKSE